ncbi:hypothetical protein MTX20_26355 [Bradyrhizobium sp. ISRA435]|nr:hypothetical protein MTX20_26355 [Bradyrhizobium sp. ISRA435]
MSIDTAINRAFICPSRAGECDVEAVTPFETDNGACTKKSSKTSRRIPVRRLD